MPRDGMTFRIVRRRANEQRDARNEREQARLPIKR
jgi:hypothetical protein